MLPGRTACSLWRYGPYGVTRQCRKFEGNLAEASASRSCGGGPGGLLFIYLFVCLFVYLFIFKFSRGSCLGCLNAIYGPARSGVFSRVGG